MDQDNVSSAQSSPFVNALGWSQLIEASRRQRAKAAEKRVGAAFLDAGFEVTPGDAERILVRESSFEPLLCVDVVDDWNGLITALSTASVDTCYTEDLWMLSSPNETSTVIDYSQELSLLQSVEQLSALVASYTSSDPQKQVDVSIVTQPRQSHE